ncbi:MAG TPA: transporter substrate-binding domain-containing protein [Chthoniobacterales bacterium]
MRQLGVWIGVWLWAGAVMASAQVSRPSDPNSRELAVGVHDKPPYAFYDGQEWRGLGVDLWRMIAGKLGYACHFQALPYEDLTRALEQKEVDVVVGELVVSAAREEVIDFSQPFLQTNILVAVNREHWRPNWLKILLNAWDWNLLRVILGVAGALLIVTVGLWLIERRAEESHFSGRSHYGLGSALWFTVVTMSGVGYGDKIPVTFLGRLVTIIWIFCGLLLVTAYTATVASTVATAQTRSEVTQISNLKRQLNAVLAGSDAQHLLEEEGTRPEKFETLEAALTALADNKVNTVVGDGVSLRYLIQQNYAGKIELLPVHLSLAHVAIAIPQNSSLRESINIALLEILPTPQWQKLVTQYVGDTPQNL